METFAGQVVMVTGGATGLGAAMVERFALLGADVACCYNKSLSAAEALAAKLRERGKEVFLVFEMTRSFNRKQFMLREHLERLYRGIKQLRIPIGMAIDEMEQAVYQTIEANEPAFEPHDEHRLMINVSRGPLAMYKMVFGGKLEPTVIIADFPVKWTVASLAHFYDDGIHCVTPSQRAIPATLLDPKIKNRSRMYLQVANLHPLSVFGMNEQGAPFCAKVGLGDFP